MQYHSTTSAYKALGVACTALNRALDHGPEAYGRALRSISLGLANGDEQSAEIISALLEYIGHH